MTEKENKTEQTEQTEEEKVSSGLYEATKKVMLAAVGAAAVAQEELTYLANKLVERGEMAEVQGKKLINEVKEHKEKAEKARKERRAKFKEEMATRDDIDMLTKKIADLTKQIEELKKEK